MLSSIEEKMSKQLTDVLAGASAASRRSLIVKKMKELEHEGVHCQGCEGNCCTFQHNSMQIDLLEAFELYCYLVRHRKLDIEIIEATISEYRLGYFMTASRDLRRGYTCPFFAGEELGCKISPNSKPYGCLAFNPIPGGQKKIDCQSARGPLDQRALIWKEVEKAGIDYLKQELEIFWEKETIPVAIWEIFNQLKRKITAESY